MSVPGLAQERLSGSTGITYQQQTNGGQTTSGSGLQDGLMLSYFSQLNPDWRTSMRGTLTEESSSTQKYSAVHPLLGASVIGEPLTLNTSYAWFDDRNYQGGNAILTTTSWNSSLGLHLRDLPSANFTYAVATSQDDLSPRLVDAERTNASFSTGYTLFQELSLSYSHSQSDGVSRSPDTLQVVVFGDPQFAAVDATGAVYVTDKGLLRVQKFNSDGGLIEGWGSGGAGPGQFEAPSGIAVDPSGDLYVADTATDRIEKFSSDGRFLLQWGSQGAANGEFLGPAGVAADASGVYVVDTNNNRVQKFDTNGVFQLAWGSAGAGNGEFLSPQGIASDGTNVFVVDTGNNRVQRFNTSGAFQGSFGLFGMGNGQFSAPRGVAVDGAGFVYVSDTGNARIERFTGMGAYLTQWGTPGAAGGQFTNPLGLAMNAASEVFVVDEGNKRVQGFLSNGTLLTLWGNGNEAATKVSRSQSSSDAFGVGFSHSIRGVLTFGAQLGVSRLLANSTSDPQGSEVTQYSFAPSIGLRLLRRAYLNYSLNVSETLATFDQHETVGSSRNQGLSLTMTPFTETAATISYHSGVSASRGSAERLSSGPSVSLTMRPLSFMHTNSSWGESFTQEHGHPETTSTQFQTSANLVLYHENAATIGYSHSDTISPESKTESITDTVSLGLSLAPIKTVSVSSREGYTLSVTEGPSPSQVASYSTSLSVSWQPVRETSLSATLNYDASQPDPGIFADHWGVSSSLAYRWDGHSLSLNYSMSRSDTESHELGANGHFALSPRAFLGLNAEWGIGGVGYGDSQYRIDLGTSF